MTFFDTIVGQEYAVTVLQNALASNRLAGSYLFTGPEGVGKATVARQFAKALCGSRTPDDRIARAIDAGLHPDYREVFPAGKSRTYRIGQLWPRENDSASREFPPENAMLRDLHFEPMAGERRVFLIVDSEALNEASGNSLLKTLEEPPRYAHFLLTAASIASVLPTIVSRCQIVHFSLIAADRVAAVLQERFGVAPAEAAFLSLTTEGRLGRAVALSRSKALLNARSDLMNWACDLATAPAIKSFKLAEELRKIAPKMRGGAEDESAESDTGDGRAREPLCRCLDVLASYYRDLLAVRAAGADAPMINVDRRLEIVGAAETRSVADLRRAVDLILHTRRAIERNANAQLAVETLLTQLTA